MDSSLPPPIPDPEESSVSLLREKEVPPRAWNRAPKMVRRAFYLVCFALSPFLIGGTMIVVASASLGRWPKSRLEPEIELLVMLAMLLLVAHGFALRRGWKISWFMQLIWSVQACGNALRFGLQFVFDLPQLGFPKLTAADISVFGDSFGFLLALFNALVLLGWLQPETRSWFNLPSKR